MGLFEKAGRRFEQMKQEATDAAKEQAEFACEGCGERFFTAKEECPECGADSVVAIEATDEASEGENAEATTDEEAGAGGQE